MKRHISLATRIAMTVAFFPVPAVAAAPPPTPKPETALFAGGCFWSMQSAFEKGYGIISAVSGYSGGRGSNPSYEDYAEKGFVEVVKVSFDPTRISYAQLLDLYWHHTDPTDPAGAFVDRGPQYRPIVFFSNKAQETTARASKEALAGSGVFGKPIVAEILPAPAFWPAEDYHQDYPLKNPSDYEFYRSHSGRDEFFARIWGKAALVDPGLPPAAKGGRFVKPGQAELKKSLSALQFDVTQRDGTEPAFDNLYWNNHLDGIYVDIVSGEALFSSRDKYDSGTGWPSFTRPLVPSNVVMKYDTSLGMVRDEVRSRYANSHLGHLFDDGPLPTGLRYCMDSAALRFIPLADMAKEGYGAFLAYFK